MTEKLKSRIVFIDTQEYRAQNFNVKNRVFSKFNELCQKNEFQLLITDITKKEIFANIEGHADELAQMLSKIHKKSSNLNFWTCQVGDKRLFEISKAEINSEFEEAVNNFLDQTKAITVATYNGLAKTVFNKYFTKSVPFGKGKKKHEFPDAFVLVALESKLEEHKDGIYVISGDSDVEAYCDITPKLYHLKSLTHLIGIYNLHQELTAFILELVRGNMPDILKNITDEIEDRMFYLSDEEGEVFDIEVLKIDIVDDIYIIDISESEAIFQFDFKATFSGNATYDDPDMGYYDKEDDCYHSLGSIETEIESDLKSSAEITIVFDRDDPAFFDIINVNVNNGDPFFIDIHSWDEYK